MNPTTVFSLKAKTYDRYRWDYAPEAIQAMKNITQLSQKTSLADLGAGTGILTIHFVDVVGHVYAIEPNPEMRAVLAHKLTPRQNVTVLDSYAEQTDLPDGHIDLITIAQAIHWFEPYAAKAEIQRILKPNGWLYSKISVPTNI